MTLRKKGVLPAGAPLTVPSPPREPVWKGPAVDGVSQTMLSRYLSDGERFRISYVEGMQPTPTFRPQLEFGNLWHAAEEAFAEHGNMSSAINPDETLWMRAVYDYANTLALQYPMQRDQIIHWIRVTIGLFPVYIDYWQHHPDVQQRRPLLQEEKFALPYKLPSGRTVILRGKWDSVDLVKDSGIWLQENKTKSSINRDQIERQLKFDLQTMLYIVALSGKGSNGRDYNWMYEDLGKTVPPIKGVRYNVIKRGTHKTAESMVKAAQDAIQKGNAAEWFARWNVEISAHDIQFFKERCLDPLLENVLDDYEWWAYCMNPYQFNDARVLVSSTGKPTSVFDCESRRRLFPDHVKRHFIMPYMGYNPLSDGGESDVDRYLFTGSTIGLERITTCFPEL